MSGDGISKELIREGNGVMPTKGEQVVGTSRVNVFRVGAGASSARFRSTEHA